MKIKITMLFISALVAHLSSAQSLVRNGSFENWVTYGGFNYPQTWEINDTADVTSGALQKVSGGSAGSNTAIRLGCSVSNIYGAGIELNDSLSGAAATGISFDYKVQNNNNSFGNGLVVQVYLYNAQHNYIDDYFWSSPALTNNNTFVTGSKSFSTAGAKYILIDISYTNVGGSLSEYAIVDNVKLLGITSGYKTPTTASSNISFYPNPVVNSIHINNINLNATQLIRLTDFNGCSVLIGQEKINGNCINLEGLAKGVYVMEIIENNGTVSARNKIVVSH